MADFKEAHAETMGNEGGCSFNPSDRGNIVVNGVVTVPTYKGIAPVFWRSWRGFNIITRAIEEMQNMPGYGTFDFTSWVRKLNLYLAALPNLQELVTTFYRVNFWEANSLDHIDNQDVANWMYDHAVNGGATGIKWIQEAVGVTADGSIGAISIKAINAADPVVLLAKAKEIAKEHRLEVCRHNPSQKQFLHSWLSRDGFSEDEIKHAAALV